MADFASRLYIHMMVQWAKSGVRPPTKEELAAAREIAETHTVVPAAWGMKWNDGR